MNYALLCLLSPLKELFQELVLGAAKYGYMTSYQDAKYQYAEANYFQFIEQWNKNDVKPNKQSQGNKCLFMYTCCHFISYNSFTSKKTDMHYQTSKKYFRCIL